MPIHTDSSAVSEHDSHSDSDWLDIASTDRDSDNDSIYSSRETDHEDPSHSRSRRSSLSLGSSRDGDVDAWEGLIEDSAGDNMPSDVLAPNAHVASLSQHSATLDLSHTQDISPEELRVKEGLDQSMISTLSSSRSSSLHASTLHNSTRDLRLSFPDPITSSCREPLGTSCEETRPKVDLRSSLDLAALSDTSHVDGKEPPDPQVFSLQPQATPVLPPSRSELKVFLFGFPTIFKWSIVNKLLQKVASGAGVTIDADLECLQGSIRRLTVSGSFEHDNAFPRIITVFDRTLLPHDTADDLDLDFSGVHPLAIIFMPCRPLVLPEHVLHLPISLPSCPSELPNFSDVETGSSRAMWDTVNIPDQRILRITASGEPYTVDKDSIDMMDSSRAYQSFSRLWSGDRVSKGIIASTHTLTIIAILSLILGLVVRAALPVSIQQFASPALATLTPNCTSCSFWQLLRPATYRERLPASTTLDTSVMVIPSSFKDSSLSVFSAESTSVALPRANPTDVRRVVPPTLSELPKFSKELMLQPPCSVLPTNDRPKALSVIPNTSPSTSYRPVPGSAGCAVSTMRRSSVPSTVKERASVVVTVMDRDMQDIFDALDALVQAISRQTQIILMQVTTLIEHSSAYLEKSVVSIEMMRGTLRAHNERARKRAKDIKELGTKWLFDASEAVATSARFSQGVAQEFVEGLAHRAQRARGRAKKMAAEIQGFLNEQDRLEVFGIDIDGWDLHAGKWDEWVKIVRKKGKRACKRKVKSSIFY